MIIIAGDFSEAVAKWAAKKKEAVPHSRRWKKAHAIFNAAAVAMSQKKVRGPTSTFSGGIPSLIGAVSQEPIQSLQPTPGMRSFRISSRQLGVADQ